MTFADPAVCELGMPEDIDDYWDPSDPSAPDPADEPQPWRSSVDEIAHLDLARSRFFGGQLLWVGGYAAEMVDGAEEIAWRDALARRLSGGEASKRRKEAVEFTRRSAWAQIALRMDLTPAEAEALVKLAEAFLARCPDTLRALEAGRISKAKALIVLEQTEQLSPEDRKKVEAAALAGVAGRTAGRFRAMVRRYVRKADKNAVRRREAKARADRRVELRNLGNGTCALVAILPTEEGVAAFGIVDAYAQAQKKDLSPGDERGIDALRADGLMSLLRNPGGQDRITYDVRVVVPVGTVLGVGDEDGYIPGHGPIPAEVCRQIAGDSEWKRLLSDPDTGHLLDVSPDTYRPSIRMVDFIESRDQTCRWPGCRRKATRCEVDHTIEFRVGGRTIRINLSAMCKFHHRLKHRAGWTVVQDPDGTLTSTTPTGEVYRTRPPTLLGEDHATERITDED